MIAMGDLIAGSWVAQGVQAVAALGVADRIGATPVAASALAGMVGANEDALYRVMRMLSANGLFKEHPGKRFTLTPLGELLRADPPNSMRGVALYHGVPWAWGLGGGIGTR